MKNSYLVLKIDVNDNFFIYISILVKRREIIKNEKIEGRNRNYKLA